MSRIRENGSDQTSKLGYSLGQSVEFFFTVTEASTGLWGSVSSTRTAWLEDSEADTAIFVNAGGTGIAGSFHKAPGNGPFNFLEANAPPNYLKSNFKTDDFNTTTINHGLYSANDNGYVVRRLEFDANVTMAAPGFGQFSPFRSPSAYFADYFGTYAVTEAGTVDQAYFEDGSGNVIRVYVDRTSVTIGPEPAAVPEPSTCVLLATSLLFGGLVARRHRRL